MLNLYHSSTVTTTVLLMSIESNICCLASSESTVAFLFILGRGPAMSISLEREFSPSLSVSASMNIFNKSLMTLSNMKVPMLLFLVGSTEESLILTFWSMVQSLLSSRLWPRTIAEKILREQVRNFLLCLAFGFLS